MTRDEGPGMNRVIFRPDAWRPAWGQEVKANVRGLVLDTETKTTQGSWRKGGGRGRAAGVWSCGLGLLYTLSVAKGHASPLEVERQRAGMSGWGFLRCS